MEYKGYIGKITPDEEAGIFHGDVINITDVITFQGKTMDELVKAFHESVDTYLDWCKEDGVQPEKPYSGKFNVRISPKLHGQAAVIATLENISLNKFVEKALKDEVELMQKEHKEYANIKNLNFVCPC